MYYLMNKNEKIAKTAFEGGLHGRHLSTTSPEYGTDVLQKMQYYNR